MSEFLDIPEQKTWAEAGLDQFGQSPVVFEGVEMNKKAKSIEQTGLSPNFIQSGEIVQKIDVADGWIQSSNFVTGVSGWRIHSDGTSEFN